MECTTTFSKIHAAGLKGEALEKGPNSPNDTYGGRKQTVESPLRVVKGRGAKRADVPVAKAVAQTGGRSMK